MRPSEALQIEVVRTGYELGDLDRAAGATRARLLDVRARLSDLDRVVARALRGRYEAPTVRADFDHRGRPIPKLVDVEVGVEVDEPVGRAAEYPPVLADLGGAAPPEVPRWWAPRVESMPIAVRKAAFESTVR